MAEFEVIEREGLRLVKATLNSETVRSESGALYYMRGQVTMESKAPSAAGFLKSMVTGETIFRPTYTGTGEVYFEPSFAAYHIFDTGGKEWILERGAYWASESGIEVDVYRDNVLNSLLSGQGVLNFQTKIKGHGKVVITAQGPIEVLQLNDDKLVVDGTFAVARTAGLNYKVEKATKSLFGSMTSGEFLVSTYQGTGTVLLAPIPNWQMFLIDSIRRSMMPVGSK